jgi:hypothetical protein
MSYKSKRWLVAAFMLLPGAAWAGDGGEPGAADFGPPVGHETLEQRRAGESRLELNLQETNATLQGNKAVSTVSGANYITGGAFHAASGFPLAVQNTGNNVVIQNAFIINLDVQ